MFSPKEIVDTRGDVSDFAPKPWRSASSLVSVDARSRKPTGSNSPSNFELQLPKRIEQIVSIELRDGFITLPSNYAEPYVLLFVALNGKYVGNITCALPKNYRNDLPASLAHDAANTAFAQMRVSRGTSPGIFVGKGARGGIVLRFPQHPLDQVETIGVRVTDIDGNLLTLNDEQNTSPTGFDRCWLQFELCASNS